MARFTQRHRQDRPCAPNGPATTWERIRTNIMIERLSREIRRCTRVVGDFPYRRQCVVFSCNEWSIRRYLDMFRFDDNLAEAD